MDKFIVTAVTLTRGTRRRAGKSWTRVISISSEPYRTPVSRCLDDGKTIAQVVEEVFEKSFNTKVIDVRPV